MSVKATITTSLRAQASKTNDIAGVVADVSKDYVTRLTPGVGTGQADLLFSDTRTLAASATENLDLAAGVTDVFGNTVTFVDVKAIVISAAPGNTNSVVVGGAASNGFVGPFGDATDKIRIPPGGQLVLTHPGAGWPVTAGTGDILLVANSAAGSPVTYDVVIIGATA